MNPFQLNLLILNLNNNDKYLINMIIITKYPK
jgi:hypothetical protein